MTRITRWVGLAVVCALTLSGCKFQGAASLPLPGGVGGNGYQVKVDFKDALDLVPQSSVKVPQSNPRVAQVSRGEHHPQTFGVPAPPQVSG